MLLPGTHITSFTKLSTFRKGANDLKDMLYLNRTLKLDNTSAERFEIFVYSFVNSAKLPNLPRLISASQFQSNYLHDKDLLLSSTVMNVSVGL